MAKEREFCCTIAAPSIINFDTTVYVNVMLMATFPYATGMWPYSQKMWDLETWGLSHEYPKYLDFQWLPRHLHSHRKLWKWFLEVSTFIFTFKQPQTYRTAHIRTICPHSQIPLYLYCSVLSTLYYDNRKEIMIMVSR